MCDVPILFHVLIVLCFDGCLVWPVDIGCARPVIFISKVEYNNILQRVVPVTASSLWNHLLSAQSDNSFYPYNFQRFFTHITAGENKNEGSGVAPRNYMFYLYKVWTIAEGPALFLCCLWNN